MLRSIDLPLEAGPITALLHLEVSSTRCGRIDDAAAIRQPSDLPAGQTLIFGADGSLAWSATTRPSFDYHWLRDLASSGFSAAVGVNVEADASAELSLLLTGSFLGCVCIEGGRLRLRLCKRAGKSAGFSPQIAISVAGNLPLPTGLDALAAAILGVHALSPADLITALSSLDAFRKLSPAFQAAISAVVGDLSAEFDIAGRLKPVVQLRNTILLQVANALRNKWTATLNAALTDAAAGETMVDCSFDFTDRGLDAYHKALAGDFEAVLGASASGVTVNSCKFTSEIARDSRIELHLPLLMNADWHSRLEALATATVETTECGRMLVYAGKAASTIERKNVYQTALILTSAITPQQDANSWTFTLDYSDTRRLYPKALQPIVAAYGLAGVDLTGDAEVDASLSLSVPGSAVAAWLEAPGQSSADYFPVWSRVSAAVQAAFRRWIPYIYFNEASRYETTGSAYPLVLYACSQPAPGKPKSAFTYDVMDRASVRSALDSSTAALPAELGRIQSLLGSLGRTSAAKFYTPASAERVIDAVSRWPRFFEALLAADAQFVRGLLNLAARNRQLKEWAAKDPERAAKNFARFSGDFVSDFHRQLPSLYGGEELRPLGSLLLLEATRALQTSGVALPEPTATLRIRGKSGERVFTNTALTAAAGGVC